MKKSHSDSGTSLIETMFAVLISLIAISSLGSAIIQVTIIHKNSGQEVTRATIYAQDKIEALLALNFSNCTQSSTVQPASCNTTGISASGWTQGLLAGGQAEPALATCPASGASVGYLDYLDNAGVQLTGSACTTLTSPTGSNQPAYIRQWQITDLPSSGPALKQVTVAVYSLNQTNADWTRPLVVLTSVLTN